MATHDIKNAHGDPTLNNGNANGTGQNGRSLSHAVTPGGSAQDRSMAPFPNYHRSLANPAPLGLIAFATTTFILSVFNAHTRGITVPNVVVGSALAYGGLCQLLAGMWEFAQGNTFGATAFSSYGGFWISYAVIQWPSSGIVSAYKGDEAMLSDAVAIFLFAWFIVTFLFLVASLRSSIALVVLFFLLDITFLLLSVGELLAKANVSKAGGIFGILTAFVAFYTGLAGMLTPSTSHFILPVGDLQRNNKQD